MSSLEPNGVPSLDDTPAEGLAHRICVTSHDGRDVFTVEQEQEVSGAQATWEAIQDDAEAAADAAVDLSEWLKGLHEGARKLLTTGNPKTEKGAKLGYLTAILHLAPAASAGRGNVCGNASKGCLKACLNLTGRGGIFKAGETTNAIQEARKARTRFLFDDEDGFMRQLYREIRNHIKRAEKHGLQPVVRLNGTSDISWENGRTGGIFYAFPEVQFYDYTKSVARAVAHARGLMPSNYHLTFSRSESNEQEVLEAVEAGANVAVVFSTSRSGALPATYHGAPVVDGDETDLRFLDGEGVVVGLRAKGPARKDTSGFTVQVL